MADEGERKDMIYTICLALKSHKQLRSGSIVIADERGR